MGPLESWPMNATVVKDRPGSDLPDRDGVRRLRRRGPIAVVGRGPSQERYEHIVAKMMFSDQLNGITSR